MAKTDVGHTGAATFHLTIDYTQSLEDMVTAGHYHYADPLIGDENFPVDEGVSEVQTILVHLKHLRKSDDVITALDCQGLRPAAMPELLAFGAQYHEVQRKFPIVALGSVWMDSVGYRWVGYLWAHSMYRELSLGCCDGEWGGHYRFLAVRK